MFIIDDVSTDNTVEVAWNASADHIIFHKRNLGLVKVFRNSFFPG